MKGRKILKIVGAALGLAAGSAAIETAQAAEKYKIYLSMSYIGNDWQAEAANMVKAMAASADMKDKVDLRVQVPDRTRRSRFNRSTRWCRRARRRSWSTRSRRQL